MDNNASTIVALSTPFGYGAIGIIRLSGPGAKDIITPLFNTSPDLQPKTVRFAKLYNNNNHIDDVLVTYFQGPQSYTGEDIIEISCHGSPYIIETIIDLCIKNGAVLAEPGEFTKRAFLNDKIDLSQAEGVDAIIHTKTKHAHETAKNLLEGKLGKKINNIKQSLIDTISLLELELDFSDQEIEFTPHTEILDKITSIKTDINSLIQSYTYGKLLKDGVKTVLIGAPNSGKSSLMNAFLKEERVIVSDIPGTTRDSIEESFRRHGYQFRLIDTAGIRKSTDKIETLGIEKSLKAIRESDIKLLLIDPFKPDIKEFSEFIDENTIIVINKIDLADKKLVNNFMVQFKNNTPISISAKDHINIHELADVMVDLVKNKEPKDSDLFLTIKRHLNILIDTSAELSTTIDSIKNGNSSELIVTDMRFALNHLDRFFGKTTNDDILYNIFSNFCIGK